MFSTISFIQCFSENRLFSARVSALVITFFTKHTFVQQHEHLNDKTLCTRQKKWRMSQKTGGRLNKMRKSISPAGSWCRHRLLTKPSSTFSFMWENEWNDVSHKHTHTHSFITAVSAGPWGCKKSTTVVFIKIKALTHLKVSLWFTENALTAGLWITKSNDHMQATDNKQKHT